MFWNNIACYNIIYITFFETMMISEDNIIQKALTLLKPLDIIAVHGTGSTAL